MKNMSIILNHLKQHPDFRKINTNEKIQSFINILPIKLKNGIKFAYIKNEILFFVLTHPIYKIEFQYNKALIKSLLNNAHMTNINDFKFFVTNKIEKKQETPKENEFYKERSYAIFKNHFQNKKLYTLLEEIRELIKNS